MQALHQQILETFYGMITATYLREEKVDEGNCKEDHNYKEDIELPARVFDRVWCDQSNDLFESVSVSYSEYSNGQIKVMGG